MAWASSLFNGLGNKTNQLSHLAPSTDVEIKEKISASTTSSIIESNEDTFRPGTVFKSFH